MDTVSLCMCATLLQTFWSAAASSLQTLTISYKPNLTQIQRGSLALVSHYVRRRAPFLRKNLSHTLSSWRAFPIFVQTLIIYGVLLAVRQAVDVVEARPSPRPVILARESTG